MAIPTSGNISIKEAAGSTRSIDTAVSSVSSGSLHTLGTTGAISYTGGTAPPGESAQTNTAPTGMREFYGYAHTSISSWPTISLPSGNAGGAFPGASGTEIQNWGSEALTSTDYTQVQCWCDAWFERDDSNNRVKVLLKSGTNVAMATEYWGYITYTGMSSPSFYVKHNYTGSVTNFSNEWSGYDYPDESPSITKDTYRQITANGSTGGKQFHWIAERQTMSNVATARVLNAGVTFTVKIVSGGVDYTVSMPAESIELVAKRGQEL